MERTSRTVCGRSRAVRAPRSWRCPRVAAHSRRSGPRRMPSCRSPLICRPCSRRSRMRGLRDRSASELLSGETFGLRAPIRFATDALGAPAGERTTGAGPDLPGAPLTDAPREILFGDPDGVRRDAGVRQSATLAEGVDRRGGGSEPSGGLLHREETRTRTRSPATLHYECINFRAKGDEFERKHRPCRVRIPLSLRKVARLDQG